MNVVFFFKTMVLSYTWSHDLVTIAARTGCFGSLTYLLRRDWWCRTIFSACAKIGYIMSAVSCLVHQSWWNRVLVLVCFWHQTYRTSIFPLAAWCQLLNTTRPQKFPRNEHILHVPSSYAEFKQCMWYWSSPPDTSKCWREPKIPRPHLGAVSLLFVRICFLVLRQIPSSLVCPKLRPSFMNINELGHLKRLWAAGTAAASGLPPANQAAPSHPAQPTLH